MASLLDVIGALANGSLASLAYTENLLGRIRARDDRVRAFASVDPSRAQAMAEACDAMRKGGAVLGPLHGLPVGVKDIFDTCDMPTERGSPIYAGNRPDRDAVIVERLKSAGAFVLGKTATTEFAYFKPAETRNPWNLAHTPGGSSAGSAAAVAAGFAHAAIGTQTNGSVIRPAAFCGVVGFKPSQGTLPFGGGFAFSPTLDQIGTFARTVADAALFTAPLVDGEMIPGVLESRSRPPVLGVIAEYPWTHLEPDAREHFNATLKRLASAGAQLRILELPPSFLTANAVHRVIMLHEAAREHRARQEEHRARLSAALNEALDEGRRISHPTYAEMLVRRAVLGEQMHDLMAECDAVVTPPAAGVAPRRLDITGDPGYCTLWSLIGSPAITLPTGLSEAGMPYGLQVVALPGADTALLHAAHWTERVIGPLQRAD